jgi:ABC-2 type transport system ATP-binding protein
LEHTLVVRNLEKNYGKLKALNGISFEVESDEVFALIGPNGAGKTTTLRIIATLLKPDFGEIFVNGNDAVKYAELVRGKISYLPEEAGAYKNLTGIGYLNFMASLFSTLKAEQSSYVETACEITGLGPRLKDKISTYSKGMTRKLLLARAIMTKPRLAILDEPTSGLDVINALEIRQTVKKFAKSGMAVLVSSHNMLEIEYLCNRVAIIHKGNILMTGTPAELKEKYGSQNLEEVFAEVAK